MVLGWRKAFCTSIPRDRENNQEYTNPTPSPKLISKFGGLFSSNPSTPRLNSRHVSSPTMTAASTLRCRTATAISPATAPATPAETPKLHCKTTKNRNLSNNSNSNSNSPRFFHFSNPSSPRSPSTFSFLKSSRLRLSKTRCGICVQNMKAGQGTAIFTAECSHSFHFPCVAAHVRKQGALTCPVCSSTWKELPVLSIHNMENEAKRPEKLPSSPKTIHVDTSNNVSLKVYDDDEPLTSPTSGTRWFNPIPESEEENENAEFQGFFTSLNANSSPHAVVDLRLLPEVAVVSLGKSSETRATVLKVKAPSASKATRRSPIDLVTVLNVSGHMSNEKLQLMKKAMRLVVSSLSGDDRLSIVAFSTASKRLLPLRRMTTAGRRSARRIVDAIAAIDGTAISATHALKKAVKVLEDRREKNLAGSVILFSDSHGDRFPTNNQKLEPFVSSTRFSHLGIPVHSIALSQANAYDHAHFNDLFAQSIGDLLSIVVQDLTIRLGCISGSAPAEIAAVYSYGGRPTALGSGSIRLGELYAKEERELLIELKVASSAIGAHHVLSVRCSYKDPSTQELVNCREQALLVPRPQAVRSLPASSIQRLKNRFITTRAIAEARRLIDRNDLGGAHHMLTSARALLLQSGSNDEFVRGLEAEMSELSLKMQQNQVQPQNQRRRLNVEKDSTVLYLDEKAEPLTPTSAWRAAEKLAKLAVVRKSMNRVSDLHGFENARF